MNLSNTGGGGRGSD